MFLFTEDVLFWIVEFLYNRFRLAKSDVIANKHCQVRKIVINNEQS